MLTKKPKQKKWRYECWTPEWIAAIWCSFGGDSAQLIGLQNEKHNSTIRIKVEALDPDLFEQRIQIKKWDMWTD